MDYALREGGWLDEFIDKPDTWIFAAMLEKQMAGFSLLAGKDSGTAEFRIALHPGMTGKGLGGYILLATLETGFLKIGLNRIDLIVRKNNMPAMKLYKRMGFKINGESRHILRGQSIEMFDMDITRNAFYQIHLKETP